MPPKNNLSFEGKTALITGASRGIGQRIAYFLNELGCHVIVTGTKDTVKKLKENQRYIPLDLADEKSINSFLKTVEKISKIDILINNAGINIIEPIDQIKRENWERIMKVNLTGPMRIMNVVSRSMIRKKIKGKILNISSIFGLISKAKRDSYSASKFGLIGLTKAAALDLAPHNILVNALCPGFVLTDLTKSILSAQERQKISQEIPLGRFAEELEIAQTAIFLCSDFNTYITGQTIVIDGGYMIR